MKQRVGDLWKPMRRSVYLRWRRPMLWGVAAAIVVATVVMSWADHRRYLSIPTDVPGYFEGRWFDVTVVMDGDTIEISDRRAGGGRRRIRLWGIDTPETTTVGPVDADRDWAQHAQAYTPRLCMGRRVQLRVDAHRLEDRFGRLLAFVCLSDGTVLNERLLAHGLAHVDRRFRHR